MTTTSRTPDSATMSRFGRRREACALLGAALLLPTAEAAGACVARSGRTVAPVVELYTSEGCNSCPPADRWLSQLKAHPEVVALAFHVDYWDRLGWKDRFASPAHTQPQARQQASNGARFNYTPQVVVNGRDRTDWPRIAIPPTLPATDAAAVELTLARDGSRVTATVLPGTASPKRLAAYWAVTEQNHVSAVHSGENQGVTLRHDYVVLDYRPVGAWPAKVAAAHSFHFDLAAGASATHPREVNLVVVDADTGKPLQALKIRC